MLFTPAIRTPNGTSSLFQQSTDITAQFAAPDPTDDRIDLVVVQILDLDTNSAEIQVVTGTPDPAPVAPDLPANAVKLWEQTVPANEPDLGNWPEADDVRDFVNTGFNGGAVGDADDLLAGTVPLCRVGSLLNRPTSRRPIAELRVLSINQARTVLQAAADPDGDDDYVGMFDAVGLTRATRPTIDPTAIADPDFQAVVVALIAIGIVIDGTP